MADRNAAEIEEALERFGSTFSCWLCGLFVLTSLPGIFNAMHIMAYVFIAEQPPYWCKVSELEGSDWTQQQIRNISSPEPQENSNCFKYDWNYTQFLSMGYNETLDFISKAEKKPELIKCESFDYNESTPKSSIVSEWDLVCDRSHLKSFSQSIIAIGKFSGAFLFGEISDKFGRKTSFILATLLYMTAAPLAAVVPSFILFSFARFCTGLAGAGVYETGYTILTEISAHKFRTLFGCAYNVTYPVGFMLLPVAAILASDWRHLQLYISVPILILFIYFWLLPESPRWLLSKGKTEKAWRELKRAGEQTAKDRQPQPQAEGATTSQRNRQEHESRIQHFLGCFKETFALCGTSEICKRIFICYFAWFVSSLCYYAIALNADNFTTNKYIYCALTGAVEIPGYIISFLSLMQFGRKPVSITLFVLSGSSLLLILVIPHHVQMGIIVMAQLGRMCISAAFGVIILQTSELFPTVDRNTAIGTSLTMSQLGVITSPYVVQFMGGEKYWYLPSTICGILSIMTAILVASLPETKDKPLANTVEELEKQEEKVSFLAICKMLYCCR